MDWNEVFALQAPPAEMFLRGSAAYWFIFLLLRLAGRRDIGQVGVADLLVLMLVADAAGNAMAGESTSTTDGLIAVSAIVFWSAVVDRIGYFFPKARAWLEPGRVCVIRDGALQRRGMRREYITQDELLTELHLRGLERFEQVKRAYVESDGKISIIAREGVAMARPKDKEGPF